MLSEHIQFDVIYWSQDNLIQDKEKIYFSCLSENINPNSDMDLKVNDLATVLRMYMLLCSEG